ncbi:MULTISPECIES: hypothetical protein [unclassified Pseudodesulfovibrio]|uniref:hypothetical protein n=1 Tax=unclassified Pseudodesulfovibrio TaxID=2661612 RepID=UPI000FEBDA81|nr:MULTISPECIES: hypothetical protein [unclassified Pseudodesulfovibrio]MCJ2165994.1 hypothetical protein [Pseudodesulfovibrio sp. S3-i]RWU02569.1 hypothetical protein DWB63_15410 [Pseudodesulfovibrio sp. S3]
MYAVASAAALLLILFAGLTVLRLSVRTSPNADLVADLLNFANQNPPLNRPPSGQPQDTRKRIMS